MKRTFDLFIALLILILLLIPIILIILLIFFTSKGPLIYWSSRVGKNNKMFQMPKFRSMKIDTPELASDLLDNPNDYLSPIGKFLRHYSLDEIPQIYSVLKGDMALVGPRPALHNQYELIKLRTEIGIHKLLPGITGWAQINGRDELTLSEKVSFDQEYLKFQSFLFDMKILFKTIFKVFKKSNISH